MNPILSISIPIIIAYLIGCFPTGYIFVKLIKKQDIRQKGSGNTGATNTMRVLGVKLALLVLAIDILKGVAAIKLGETILNFFYVSSVPFYLSFVGLAVILGHIFSVFLRFKGGKGVATAAGVFVMLTPLPTAIALVTFLLITSLSKYVSVGSIFAVIMLFLSELYLNVISQFSDVSNLVLIFIIGSFVIYKHKDNIKRLSEGTENQLNFRKKAD
jgi:acyl phosphate:glycerol-3-phosphate acyltransferase